MTETISNINTAAHSSPVPQETALESEHVTIIAPAPGWRALNMREMWNYRELLYFLIWRDIKVRYKQTLLGAAWAILQPLMYTFVFFIVFFRIAHAPSEGLPYLLFAFSGLSLWFFFSTAITQAGNSVIGSEAMITKVYFPRLAIPFAAVGAALFDFFITLFVLVLMIGYYVFFSKEGAAIEFTWQILLAPVIVFLTVLAALGVGAFLAALNVSYRDFKHTIPFLVQLWLFATPAIYFGVDHESLRNPPVSNPHKGVQADAALSKGAVFVKPQSLPSVTAATVKSAPDGAPGGAVPDWVQRLLKFNPLTGLVRAFRASVLGQPMPWTHLAYSTAIVITTFLAGCFYYHRVEDDFADII
ncbi:MAG: ABC transporter permease [Planctomycetes bacterium]|nr:ABC transporter permease [Planctomycetota bacterium]